MHQFDYLFGDGFDRSSNRETVDMWFGDGPPKPKDFNVANEKDDSHYIGMSLFFLALPFTIYGFIHLFI